MDGLNRAADSTANSDRKYDPINSCRCSDSLCSMETILRTCSNRPWKSSLICWWCAANFEEIAPSNEPTSLSEIERIEVTILCTRWWSPGVKGRSRTRDGSGFSSAWARLTWTALRSWAVVSSVTRLRVAMVFDIYPSVRPQQPLDSDQLPWDFGNRIN